MKFRDWKLKDTLLLSYLKVDRKTPPSIMKVIEPKLEF